MTVDGTIKKGVLMKLDRDVDHGDVVEVTNPFFITVFTTPEDEIFFYIHEFLTKYNGCKYKDKDVVAYDDENYLYYKGNIPVLLVSHVDIVKPNSKRIYETTRSRILTGEPNGYLGGDDRAGVAGMLWIAFDGFKPHMLFTKGEEKGLIGARAASKEIPSPDVMYITALDRPGKDQCAYYNNGNKDFKKYIEKFGLREVIGTGNDIRVLCPAWNISGVNVSIGYASPHTNSDHVVLDDFVECIDRVEKMLDNPPCAPFGFVEVPETRSSKLEYHYPEMYRKSFKKIYKQKLKNTYPYLSPSLDIEDKTYIFAAMRYMENLFPEIFFDFARMEWNLLGLEQKMPIDMESLDFYGLLEKLPYDTMSDLEETIDYLRSRSDTWIGIK